MNDGHNLTSPCLSRRFLASAAACCILATSAFGQAALPNELINGVAINEQQKTVLREHVAPLLPQLKVANTLKPARDRLLEPLGSQNVSAAFRLELWRNVASTAQEMVKAADDVQKVNGLRIAGEIATDSSVDAITPALKDKNASIRFAASFAIMRAFEQTHGKPAAMSKETAIDLINAIANAMKVETDANCFDSMVRALAAAGSDRQSIDPIVQRRALESLSTVCSEVLQKNGDKAIEDTRLEAFVRALTCIRDSFTKPQAQAAPPSWTNDGAAFAGDALTSVYHQIRKSDSELAPIKTDDAEDAIEAKKAARRGVAQLVFIAESTITLARQIRGNPNQTTSVADQLKRAEVKTDASALEDMNSLLTDKLPKEFTLPADRFLK